MDCKIKSWIAQRTVANATATQAVVICRALTQLGRSTRSKRSCGFSGDKDRLTIKCWFGGIDDRRRGKIKDDDGGQSQMSANGAVILVLRAIWPSRMFVRFVEMAIGARCVHMMRMPGNGCMAVNSAVDARMTMPLAHDHGLRGQRDSEENRQISIAVHASTTWHGPMATAT